MNEININDELNEINIFDEIAEVIASIGNKLGEAIESVIESIQDMVDGLEPYQRYELLHPRKKPRGSIRRNRKRKRREYTCKDCYEIGKVLYKGMMDGFGIEEQKESDNNDKQP